MVTCHVTVQCKTSRWLQHSLALPALCQEACNLSTCPQAHLLLPAKQIIPANLAAFLFLSYCLCQGLVIALQQLHLLAVICHCCPEPGELSLHIKKLLDTHTSWLLKGVHCSGGCGERLCIWDRLTAIGYSSRAPVLLRVGSVGCCR